MRASTAGRWAEGIGAGALIALAGLLRPGDMSFMALGFMPQSLVAVVMAALLGAGPGLATLVTGLAVTCFLPLIAGLLGIHSTGPTPLALLSAARFPVALGVAGVAAAGFLRDSDRQAIARQFGRIGDLTKRLSRQEKVGLALSSLNEGLERRVAGQRDSISALHARIRKMDSLDLGVVLSGLLEAVEAFSQASEAVIFEFDPKRNILRRAAGIGKAAEESLSLDATVEGWAFRNDSIFTLRKLDDYLGFGRTDTSGAILAYPLKAGDLPWGVLAVREMPFYRYNPVTERNLEVVIELASSYVKKAADFKDKILSHPLNEVTGLPGYGELLRMLGEELTRRTARQLPVAVVLVELLGFEDLVFAHSGLKAFELLKELVVQVTKGNNAYVFHAREDGQVAFLLPDIDREGASLFCLGVSTAASEFPWLIDGKTVCLELAFGICAWPNAPKGGPGAAAGPVHPIDAGGLLSEAESILALSKNAFLEHGRCE